MTSTTVRHSSTAIVGGTNLWRIVEQVTVRLAPGLRVHHPPRLMGIDAVRALVLLVLAVIELGSAQSLVHCASH